jgi:hypothetical protein
MSSISQTPYIIGRWHNIGKWIPRSISLILLAVIAYMTLAPSSVFGYAGLGGYLSEKLLGAAGNASSLYLGSGAAGPTILGSGPLISTSPVTDATLPEHGAATATLRGNLANLNSMPSADVWFVWGYSAATMSNTTPIVTVTTTGEKTAAITGYDPGLTVYYSFRGYSEGLTTLTGGTLSFIAGGGRGVSFWLLSNILTLVIAAIILIVAFRVGISGNWTAALILVIIGILAIALVRGLLESLL